MRIHDWSRFPSGVFHDFHQAWTVGICRELNQSVLPEGYYALIEMPPAATELEVFAAVFGHDRLDERGRPIEVSDEDERQIYVAKKNVIGIHKTTNDSKVARIEIVAPGNKSSPQSYQRFLSRVVEALQNRLSLLLIDILPLTLNDPRGLHAAVWESLGQEPVSLTPAKGLTIAAYVANEEIRAYVEPAAIGDSIPTMPLFVTPSNYVNVRLGEAYDWALSGMPSHLRRELDEGGS